MIELKAPAQTIKAHITIPGSKSLSNRYLIINEVLGAQQVFNQLSNSEDTRILKNAIKQIHHGKEALIDVGQAGTCMRFLCALLSISTGNWVLTGSDRMKQRPIAPLVSSMQQLGANIKYVEKENFPPLAIKGRALHGGEISIDGSISSQFVSALLLVAPTFKNGLTLTLTGKQVSEPYVRMTLELLKRFGVNITSSENSIRVEGFSPVDFSAEIEVEPDWSSASYFYSICALSSDAKLNLKHFCKNSLQGDSQLPLIYQALGVRTEFTESGIKISSQTKTSSVFTYNFSNCPDLAQTLAVTCFGLGMEAHLSGLETLKHKETDRIAALKAELQKFGASVETGSDYLHIEPQESKQLVKLQHAGPISVNTYNDHRMAMCFAPLAISCKTLRISDEKVVVKSYPTFWDDLISLGFSVNLQP